MLKRLSIQFLLILSLGVFAFGQEDAETYSVGNSTLTEANLPTGAQRVRKESVPEEMRATLAKLIAEAGSKVRQGSDSYEKAITTKLCPPPAFRSNSRSRKWKTRRAPTIRPSCVSTERTARLVSRKPVNKQARA